MEKEALFWEMALIGEQLRNMGENKKALQQFERVLGEKRGLREIFKYIKKVLYSR
jgi:hypothetical protein